MRCLTLADGLAAKGVDCQFICREHDGNLIGLIRKKGYVTHALPMFHEMSAGSSQSDPKTYPLILAHGHWLGATQAQDADACAPILTAQCPDWLIVDHYALDASWERSLVTYARMLMVIDDLADRPHICDLLLDQNWLGTGMEDRYQALVPQRARQYLGPAYALLKPEYTQLRKWRPPHDGHVRRLLVFFGGSDPVDLTSRALNALSAPEFNHLVVDVVLGPNHPNVASVTRLAQTRSGVVLHGPLPSLAGLMLRADLMLGAGGSTNWERMCLGLPTVVISIAENQIQINAALARAGYVVSLGFHEDVQIGEIRVALQRAMQDTVFLRKSSQYGMALVEGAGVTQVVNLLIASI